MDIRHYTHVNCVFIQKLCVSKIGWLGAVRESKRSVDRKRKEKGHCCRLCPQTGGKSRPETKTGNSSLVGDD